jgi:hypothetical protein
MTNPKRLSVNNLVFEALGIGKHNNIPDSKFPSDQLKKGEQIESEHSDDPEKKKAIAKDHLAEFKDYYSRLKNMEQGAEDKLPPKT